MDIYMRVSLHVYAYIYIYIYRTFLPRAECDAK